MRGKKERDLKKKKQLKKTKKKKKIKLPFTGKSTKMIITTANIIVFCIQQAIEPFHCLLRRREPTPPLTGGSYRVSSQNY